MVKVMPNRQCPECGGWELQDGTEDADWNQCECDVVECSAGCGEKVNFGGYCSMKCSQERGHNAAE